MHFLTLVCLILLGATVEQQESTWNIMYDKDGKVIHPAEQKFGESTFEGDELWSTIDEENLANLQSSDLIDEENSTDLYSEISLQVYPDGSVECPVEDGTFHISGLCGFYIVCSNGYPEFFTCTNGMHFNPEEQKCDLPIRAGCEVQQCHQYNGTTGIPGKCDRYLECINGMGEEKNCPKDLHFSQIHRSCVEPEKANCEFTCPENYGFYPILGYCEEYAKCQDGEIRFQRCPPGLRFNSMIKMCDIPERATCIDNCPQPNGIFPIEGYNSAFLRCSNNVPKIHFCEEGKTFSFSTSRCDRPETDGNIHKCPSPNGRFRLPGNRTELFIECINDNVSVKRCPSQLHLNPDSENCEN